MTARSRPAAMSPALIDHFDWGIEAVLVVLTVLTVLGLTGLPV